MREARVIAQAKINLLLRVLARDVGGYHSIETILLRLDLGDDVRVRITPERSLECTGLALPAGGLGPVEQNLAYRAAAAYASATGWPQGFAIEIDKRIPVAAGLGGGSADAGAVLRALDALSPNPLGRRLVELATPLGADVPFMTIESPMALAWGRGERLLALRPPRAAPVLILVPGFGVSAGDAYSWLSTDRGDYGPRTALFDEDSFADWGSIAAIAANDLEPPVVKRHSVIGELVGWLRKGEPAVAMMSGSGSTVFGVFDGLEGAAGVLPPGVTHIVTSTSERVLPVAIES
jgi:4-diphosphocytidyl-2-C-methyl-D-erythritol kinase